MLPREVDWEILSCARPAPRPNPSTPPGPKKKKTERPRPGSFFLGYVFDSLFLVSSFNFVALIVLAKSFLAKKKDLDALSAIWLVENGS